MGNLQRILSWRTQLDLLLKLQSDSNRKKELVKECKLEHRSSENGLQARASLPTATDLWQYSDRNWKDYIFMLDLMINLNFMAVSKHGPTSTWRQTEHLHHRTCPWDVYSGASWQKPPSPGSTFHITRSQTYRRHVHPGIMLQGRHSLTSGVCLWKMHNTNITMKNSSKCERHLTK